MKSKVMLFDASGAPVGETFTRRARQLVNQQRAEWISEGAIRFAPDTEIEESEWGAVPEDTKKSEADALLYYIAKMRLKQRKAFIVHSILMIPGYFIAAILAAMAGNEMVLVVLWFGWTTPYILHATSYISERWKEYRPDNRGKMLEVEVDKLRRLMG